MIVAAIPVVPLPLNGSKMISPGFVDARIIRFKRANGFCVGCFPNFFSCGDGVGILQTLHIWKPAFLMKSSGKLPFFIAS
jgi:hypothetical protein